MSLSVPLARPELVRVRIYVKIRVCHIWLKIRLGLGQKETLIGERSDARALGRAVSDGKRVL
jgi:hypothetical protein